MARLPIVGDDDGDWGDILNDYLSQSLDSGGLLKNNSVTTNAITNANVTHAKLESSVQTSLAKADAAAPLASPTFTGTVTTPALKVTGGSPAAGKVLTSDADGDATWADPDVTQAELDAKAPITDPTFQNSVNVDNDSGGASVIIDSAPGNWSAMYFRQDGDNVFDFGANDTTFAVGRYPTLGGVEGVIEIERDTGAIGLNGTTTVPALKVTGGSPGVGKVLTSDADGDATWADPDVTQAELDAKVADTITDGVTNVAPSQNAVYDALANKQPLNSNLTTIAGLTPTTNNFIVANASAWASRTPAQAKTHLALVKGDVGLGNVDNTSDATKNAAAVTLTNKTLTSPVVTGATTSASGMVWTATDGSGHGDWAKVPYDVSIISHGKDTTRAAGTGDNPFGVKLQRAVTFTSVTFRALTADASGNGVYKIQKNGSDVSGMTATVSSANQVAGGTATGSWSFALGDILTLVCVSNGTTPGKGLVADILGSA